MVGDERAIRDHLQDVLLSALYNSVDEGNILIFKGGTALRKVYGLDRYSDDLDFNIGAANVALPGYIYKLRERAIGMLSPLYAVKIYVHKANEGYTLDALISGRGAQSKIRIEISTMKTYLRPLIKRVITQESAYTVSAMDINEIFAEKIRAVYTRRNIDDIARDLVDIHFIISKNGALDMALANRKLGEVGHKQLSLRSFAERIALITDRMWNADLSEIMGSVPGKNETVDPIMAHISKRLKAV